MSDAIFLSASVPDPKRDPKSAITADSVAITAAVSALVYVTLGRRLLVWGGHPAITPMIWVVADTFRLDYAGWVKLYQSRYFEDDFPSENAQFQNVTYTDAVDKDRQKSLQVMRQRMLSENRFSAAVFVGGMAGVLDEFDMFQRLQPKADAVPIFSTGGAVLELQGRLETSFDRDLTDEMDYVALFHRLLGIDVRELRYRHPGAQPDKISDRLWPPSSDKAQRFD